MSHPTESNTAAASSEPLVQIEREADVLLVKLNRPSKRNAINDALIAELEACFSSQLGDARVVVLHGEGAHFCAGLDLFELMKQGNPDVLLGMRRSRQWHRVFDSIQFGEIPVVSVLKGGVIGGGFELAASTHVRVVEQSAFFQLPEGQRGIFLGGSGSVRIPRLIGSSRVLEMMLTGRSFDARKALDLGLAHELVEDGQGLAKARELAQAIAKNERATNFAVINGIGRISEMSMGEGLFAETMVTVMTKAAGTNAAKRINEFFDGRRQAKPGES
jgi:enoyl-CoA hydratase/carnithine racemase